MIFATRRNGTRDGELLVVSRDRRHALKATGVASCLQAALDNWAEVAPRLQELSDRLNRGACTDVIDVDVRELMAPLPRAYAWLDGSAYLNHVILVRKARGAEPPATVKTDPLMYQGGSDAFLGPCDPILMADEAWGIDFESEVAVVTDDVPMGETPAEALDRIRLVMICNDVSLRNLIPDELAKGFGFVISKPSSAFAPFALTPDELGSAWQGGRVHLPLETWLNGKLFGTPEAGPEMHFSFPELLAHVARTRPLRAGTIMGSGTVSNEDRSKGSSCLAEKRMIEKIDTGTMTTPFLRFGDHVRIRMLDRQGVALFGEIDQKVVQYKK